MGLAAGDDQAGGAGGGMIGRTDVAFHLNHAVYRWSAVRRL